jgi:hypothetical protein
MDTVTMLCTDQEMLHADNHKDCTQQEEHQEMPAQGMDKALPDASLHDCRVEMVPLKDIYVEGDPQDEDLVTALADSICHIGLQNPICVVKNDLPAHDFPYRIVSGRQRYQAYMSLGREYIPCHMLTYDEEAFADEKKQLAQYEENLLRKHLTLIETCTLLGKAKEAYLKMYPETGQGKASPKNPGTGRLPYALIASQMLGKSKSTIEKYLQIYTKVLKPFAPSAEQTRKIPDIFEHIEELSILAQQPQENIPLLLDIIFDRDQYDVWATIDAVHILRKRRDEQKTLASPSDALPKSASTSASPADTPAAKTATKSGEAPEQPDATSQESAKSSREKPVQAPSPLQEWLARVHDFGAKFNTIAARYYGEKDAYKVAVFQKYREEIRRTMQQMFPSAADQNSLHKHWHNDTKDLVECSFTYASKDPRYELRIKFSLTKAVHSKPR